MVVFFHAVPAAAAAVHSLLVSGSGGGGMPWQCGAIISVVAVAAAGLAALSPVSKSLARPGARRSRPAARKIPRDRDPHLTTVLLLHTMETAQYQKFVVYTSLSRWLFFKSPLMYAGRSNK